MFRFRAIVKLTFALLAVWLGIVWAGLLPRPAFLPPELDIKPLTYLLGAVAAILFIFWKNPAPATANSASTPPDESVNAEIRAYLKSRYEHRIHQKLAGREPVNLRKTPSSTGTSGEAAQNFITLPAEKVPFGMAELFDEARGRLLVVGAPGAGKTTLLLQLALELLRRNETVPAALAAEPSAAATKVAGTAPVPVLLNLATWRSEFASFDAWLQRILPLELSVSKALAEKIRRNIPLIILLDGLDEAPETERSSCLLAIGEYGSDASHRFAISSRIAEYTATQDAPVYLEVEVQPLTPEQVVDNLTAYAFYQPEAKPLLNALQTDPLLKTAIANPFYLNTAQLLFASGRKYSDFGFTATDVGGRQRELVERFVEDALERKVKREYQKEKARKWLGFLAGKMEESGKVVFELVDIQPTWLKSKILSRFNNFISNFISFLSSFWVLAITVLPVFLFIILETDSNWLSALFLLIIFLTNEPNYILPYENQKWRLKFLKQNWKEGLITGLLLGSLAFVSWTVISLYYFEINLSQSIGIGVICGMLVGLICGAYWSGLEKEKFLQVKVPYERFTSSLLNFDFSIFQHFAARLFLSLENSLPLRLVTFLNEMSLRHLFEFDGDPTTGKGGGAWRWRHRIIQEYFLEAREKD